MRFPRRSHRAPATRRRGGSTLLLKALPALVALVLIAGAAAAFGMFATSPERQGQEVTPTPAGRDATPTTVTASAGPERPMAPVELAVHLSQRAFPAGNAPNVLLAKDTGSADALAASGLQGQLSAPLLLTSPERLSPETAAELERLGNPEIHILGGVQAVAYEVEEGLVRAGHTLHRHAGLTGAHTAVDIASRHFRSSQSAVLISLGQPGSDPSRAVVDSLPASSLAAAEGLPVLLTEPDRLSDVTADYLASSRTDQVYVVGDPSVVSEEVVTQLRGLGIEVRRVAGADRFATAVEVARARGFADASDASVVVLAQGRHGEAEADSAWPGSFIGSINTGRFGGAPMVLADGETLPESTRDFLTAERSATTFLLCAPGVSESTCEEARALVRQADGG